MASRSNDSTVSVQIDRGSSSAPALQQYLFGVLQADRPLAPCVRVPLAGLYEVQLGRTANRAVEAPAPGLITLGFPDRSVSTRHAVLRQSDGQWHVEDLRSKNGTKLNGARVQDARLSDGDWLEVGNTFLRFRSRLPAAQDPAPLDSERLVVSVPGLFTLHPALAEEFARLALVAPSLVPVLLGGESGAGKEVAAAAVHRLSRRRGPFIPVNCGALAKNLVESELFGYRKGAFSGATEDRTGLIRASDGGTLFLDEIGDLPLEAQASLLRVLQESQVTPVGSTRPVEVDLRLVAATHRDLGAMAEAGTFRADLLARLTGFAIGLPPLRDRREDLGLLIASLLERHFPAREGLAFTPDAARALLCAAWPLNIRELEKCLTTAVVLAAGKMVELAHLPAPVREPAPKRSPSKPELVAALSPEDAQLRARLVTLFTEHRGNVTAVAAAVGKARFQVQRWVKRLAIELDGFKR